MAGYLQENEANWYRPVTVPFPIERARCHTARVYVPYSFFEQQCGICFKWFSHWKERMKETNVIEEPVMGSSELTQALDHSQNDLSTFFMTVVSGLTWQASTVPNERTRWVFLGMTGYGLSCTPLSPSLISHLFVFITFWHHLWSITMGSLRCHYDEENENLKKVIGSAKQNNNLHVHHAFLYYSWPSLHDYDMNWTISPFTDNVNVWGRIPLSLFKLEYLS